MTEKELTPEELKRQADAILAAADAAEAEEEKKKPAKKKGAKAEEKPAENVPGPNRLDDKTVASLPAAALIMNNEKLRELLGKGKKKGKLDSGELMETLDDLNLESEQMDQI